MTPAALPETPVLTSRSSDFADWLSPILVKELRQGMQSRVFVSVFVLVQAAMILFVGLRLIGSTGNGAEASMFDGIFTFCVWMPLLVLMPARGLGAIGEEMRAQTMDLVQLTRLSSFRIAWGKWLALVAQTFLLATSMLPYAVLRYYFGKVDVVAEVMILGMLLIVSMLLTAAAVAVSAAPIAIRIVSLLMLVPLFMAYTARASMIFVGGIGGSSSGLMDTHYLEMILWTLPSAAVYIYFFLELTASKIAPMAENHAVRKRTLALSLCAAIVVCGVFFDEDIVAGVLALSIPIVAYVVVEALCENLVPLPGLYRPFALRGFFARLLGRVMYPGWATGTIFTTLVFALVGGGFYFIVQRVGNSFGGQISKDLPWVAFLTFFSVISPLPILQLFPRFKKRFWPYLLVQALSLLLLIIGLIIADSRTHKEEVLTLLGPVPTAALFVFISYHSEPEVAGSVLKIARVTDAVLAVWVCFLVYRQMRPIRQLERLALSQEEPSSPAS